MDTKKLGILGAGQLGRMLALAGTELGIEIKLVDQKSETPASYVADVKTLAYEEFSEIQKYFEGIEIITYEFENIPESLLLELSKTKTVYPPIKALQTSRHRGLEKSFVKELGVGVPNFTLVNSFSELKTKVSELTFPLIVKTCTEGYDGKGQWRFLTQDELIRFDHTEVSYQGDLIAEQMIDFDYEVSCIGVRSVSGEIVFYPLCENHHDGGILSYTKCPSLRIPTQISKKAITETTKILESLSYVGTLAVEYFVRGDELLFNEYAPRVHNSGHWTIEGSETSQFENHVRACLGISLGETNTKGWSLMLNLLGVTGQKEKIENLPSTYYHWYDKKGLGGRRKVGHVTAVFNSEQSREENFLTLKNLTSENDN